MNWPQGSSVVAKVVFLLAVAAGPAWAATPTVMPGEAGVWQFPAGYAPKPLRYSGIYQMDARRLPPMLPHLGRTLTWAALNPRDGIYDFSYVERELKAAADGGYMIVFRLKASVIKATPPEVGQDGRQPGTIPGWVVDKYHLVPEHSFLASDPAFRKGDGYKQYASPWHPGVQQEFKRLLVEISHRGLLESNHVAAVYLHGMSVSFGEEFDLRHEHYAANANRAAKASGYTGERYGNPLADAIMDCWTKRMQWWAEAAGDRVYKVAFVGSGNMPGYPYPQDELLATALRLGIGQRYGNLEEYYYGNVIPPKQGQRYVPGGYVEVDWHHPVRDGRYWGDENEEMNHFRMPDGRVPSPEVRALCYRSSFFRAAQLGMNFLWTNSQFIDAAGTDDGRADDRDYLPKWFTQIAGKGPDTSPDAIAWLRLAYIRVLPGAQGVAQAQPWNNLERLLLQRDHPAAAGVAGALTKPALPMDFPYVALKLRDAPDGPPESSDNEYTARRTDLATGNPDMAFLLDPEFRASLHEQRSPAQIRVHFLHDRVAPFTVRVSLARAPFFTDLGVLGNESPDGTWKTAVFDVPADALPQPDARSGLGQGVDFVVRALGQAADQDLTVRYVRLNRVQEIARPPAIVAGPRSKRVTTGLRVQFAVHAEGPGELAYQWLLHDVALTDGGRITGANTDTLRLENVSAADAGAVSVVVSNAVRGITRTVRAEATLTLE